MHVNFMAQQQQQHKVQQDLWELIFFQLARFDFIGFAVSVEAALEHVFYAALSQMPSVVPFYLPKRKESK